MYTLTINLTGTLVAEWAFTDLIDFERAATAARATLTARPLVDIDDLQTLADATLAPFDEWPSNGDIEFNIRSAAPNQVAEAA
jgi:hypothetical protein